MKFEKQTYTQVPNSLFKIMGEMDECELKVVLLICRYTFGYHRDEIRLSTRRIADEIGMNTASVQKGADKAIERGLIEKEIDGNKTTVWRALVGDSEIESPACQKLNRNDSEIESLSGVKESIKDTSKESGASAPNFGLDWKLGHGQEVTQHDLDEAALMDQAPRMFEKAFGVGTWPWSSNNIWTKFEKFIREIHRLDPQAFGKYVIWRAGPGKYTGMSNKQIRVNPQVFMDTGWAEFEKSQTAGPSKFHPKYHDPVPPDPNEGKYAPPPKTRPNIGGRRSL